jgi:hypothetical protein
VDNGGAKEAKLSPQRRILEAKRRGARVSDGFENCDGKAKVSEAVERYKDESETKEISIFKRPWWLEMRRGRPGHLG